MLRVVHYGPYSFEPWCPGTGYLDVNSKSLKSYRSREPHSIWQSLPTKTDELGSYELYVCRHCFLYTAKLGDIEKHEPLCRYRDAPPGRKIYDEAGFEFREIAVPTENPENIKMYLQCLSLFGHLFLETKSICFSIDPFLFYVAIDKASGMAGGFFSKEIHSWFDYNLACIVTFPPFQSRGLGQRLIKLSYLLTRFANTVGSPEKPLSEHGQKAYASYWRRELAYFLSRAASRKSSKKLSLDAVAKGTGIEPQDLAATIESKNAFKLDENGEKVLLLRSLIEGAKILPSDPTNTTTAEDWAVKAEPASPKRSSGVASPISGNSSSHLLPATGAIEVSNSVNKGKRSKKGSI